MRPHTAPHRCPSYRGDGVDRLARLDWHELLHLRRYPCAHPTTQSATSFAKPRSSPQRSPHHCTSARLCTARQRADIILFILTSGATGSPVDENNEEDKPDGCIGASAHVHVVLHRAHELPGSRQRAGRRRRQRRRREVKREGGGQVGALVRHPYAQTSALNMATRARGLSALSNTRLLL